MEHLLLLQQTLSEYLRLQTLDEERQLLAILVATKARIIRVLALIQNVSIYSLLKVPLLQLMPHRLLQVIRGEERVSAHQLLRTVTRWFPHPLEKVKVIRINSTIFH